MGIHIQKPEVEAKARELAALTGEDVIVAVERAVIERLARAQLGGAENAADADIDVLLNELNALPVLDERSLEDMLYDQDGLPA